MSLIKFSNSSPILGCSNTNASALILYGGACCSMVYCGEKFIAGVMSQTCTYVFYSSCLNDCRPSRDEAIISKNCSVRWT